MHSTYRSTFQGLVSVRTSPLADTRKELLYTVGRQNLQKESWRTGISHGSDPHWIHTLEYSPRPSTFFENVVLSVAALSVGRVAAFHHVARVSWQRVQC